MAVKITVLIENTRRDDRLEQEHGLAYWIESGDYRILFDTGQSNKLIKNAGCLGIDLTKADAIVLSHGHYDHSTGLAAVVEMAARARIYLHPLAMKMRYKVSAGSDPRYIGMSGSSKAVLEENRNRIIYKESYDELFHGIWVTGEIPWRTDHEKSGSTHFDDPAGLHHDCYEDDQAMVFKVKDGVVLLLGCAHRGVINTLKHVESFYPALEFSNQKVNIKAVIGGFHLYRTDHATVHRTIEALKHFEPECISPLHCSGDYTVSRIKNSFPAAYQPGYTGKQFYFE